MKEKVASVVSNNGEIIDEICVGDKIIRKSTSDYLDSTIEIGKDKRFVKLFESTIDALGDEALTGKQWRILMIIIRYFRYDSGLISFENGNPLTVDHISDLTNIPKRTVFDSMEKLVTKKIIAKNKVGYEIKYYINPFIFCKGTRINKTLYSMFEKTKWRKIYELDK